METCILIRLGFWIFIVSRFAKPSGPAALVDHRKKCLARIGAPDEAVLGASAANNGFVRTPDLSAPITEGPLRDGHAFQKQAFLEQC